MIKLINGNRLYISSLLIVALLSLAWGDQTHGKDDRQDVNSFFVASNGSDTNPGTQPNPWRTIQFAVDQVAPGDTIYVRAGTYNESVALNQEGIEGNPITLKAYGDEAVTINGGEAPAITALTSQWEGTQYWIIEGFTLDSNAEYTIEFSIWSAFSSNHMVIRNNYIRGAAKVSGSYNLFEGNEVDGSQHKGSEDGVQEFEELSHHNVYRNNHIHHFSSRGIWSEYRTHDSIFENNYIHHIENGDGQEQGIDLDGFGSVVWRHTVRGNHIHYVDKVPIALENTFDSVVENNIIHDSSRGIAVINYGGDVGSGWGTGRCEVGGENNQYGDTDGDDDCRGNNTGNIIRQNLIYDINTNAAIMIHTAGGIRIMGNTIHNKNTTAVGIYLDSSDYCQEIEIRGNIISESRQGAINIQNVDSLVQDSNNLIQSPEGIDDYYIAGNGFSLAQYKMMTGKGVGSVDADPQFVDSLGYNFRLKESSPAIDTGFNIESTTDIYGNPRPQGLAYDMGVYEYNPTLEIALAIYLPIISSGHER